MTVCLKPETVEGFFHIGNIGFLSWRQCSCSACIRHVVLNEHSVINYNDILVKFCMYVIKVKVSNIIHISNKNLYWKICRPLVTKFLLFCAYATPRYQVIVYVTIDRLVSLVICTDVVVKNKIKSSMASRENVSSLCSILLVHKTTHSQTAIPA